MTACTESYFTDENPSNSAITKAKLLANLDKIRELQLEQQQTDLHVLETGTAKLFRINLQGFLQHCSTKHVLFVSSQRVSPFTAAPTAVTRPGLCAGAGGAAGQNCVLQALDVMGLWWFRQPAAGRPCRRHWMERVWTPPPQDTEH